MKLVKKSILATVMAGAFVAAMATAPATVTTVTYKNSSGQPVSGATLEFYVNETYNRWVAPVSGNAHWEQVKQRAAYQYTTDANGQIDFTSFAPNTFGLCAKDVLEVYHVEEERFLNRGTVYCDGNPMTNDMPASINLTQSTTKGKVTRVGLRASLYGATTHPDYLEKYGNQVAFPSASEWKSGADNFKSHFTTSKNPTLIWIVGEAGWENGSYTGDTELKMVKPSGSFDSKIKFTNDGGQYSKDGWYKDGSSWKGYDNDDYLNYYDANNIDVFLQIEPANANILQQIEIVMERFGSHNCVAGFGIDLEFYDINSKGVNRSYPSKSEVQSWYNKVKSYGSKYELFLKHFKIEAVDGDGYRGANKDIIYINDVQDMGGLPNFLISEEEDGMIEWADHFGNNPIWFQIGYGADWYHINSNGDYDPAFDMKPWYEQRWGSNPDDIVDGLADALINNVKSNQDVGVIWVDFTMRKLFPQRPTVLPAPAPLDVPVLMSDNFNSYYSSNINYTNWEFYSDNAASAESWLVNGANGKECHTYISGLGSEAWHIHLRNGSYNIEQGKTYTIKFKARTESGKSRSIDVKLQENGNDWTTYGSEIIEIDDIMRTYEVTLTMNNATDSDTYIVVDMGRVVEDDVAYDVIIDDVEVFEN